jgi:glycosyltransferase involved in cell wall biosynthesis
VTHPVTDVTAIIPWHGADKELYEAAYKSLPAGMTVLTAWNEDRIDMIRALNQALDHVKTPWVWIMGADDLAGPGMLERLLEGVGSADAAYPTLRSFGAFVGDMPAQPFSKHRVRDENGIPGVFLIRTEWLRKVGGWVPSPLEDWEVIWRLIEAGCRFEPVPDAIYHYRRREGTNSMVARAINDGDFTYEELREATTGPRVDLAAIFYCQASPGQNYVRAAVPAEYMPAAARIQYDGAHRHHTDTTIWLHPGSGSVAGIRDARRRGQRIVVDVDDDYLHPKLVETLERQAVWEPKLREIARQWRKEQPEHRKIVEAADLVVCATPALAEAYARVNPNVAVVRNGVEPLHWPATSPRGGAPAEREAPSGASRGIRVGWAAARQHGPDARIAEPALRWAASQPNVEVVVLGVDPKFDFKHTLLPMTRSLQQYRDTLATFDVGICPLRSQGINHSKSDLKWLEYTMGGAAVVVSDLEPYRTVKDGVTGLVAANRAEMRDHVQTLVGDAEIREGLVRQAQSVVLGTRTGEHMAADWNAALETRVAVAA